MYIDEVLKESGYKLLHESGCSEDWTEIWINKNKQMCICIEWYRLD